MEARGSSSPSMRSHSSPFRRRLLAGLLAVLAFFAGLVHAAEPRVRKNVRALEAGEKTQLVRSLLWMKTHPPGVGNAPTTVTNAYDWLVWLHNRGFAEHLSGGSGVHMAPSFFPWHREFLAALEWQLDRAGDDLGYTNRLGVPYWDWTDPASVPVIFDDAFMGGNGGGPNASFTNGLQATRGSPFRVRTGPFATADDRTTAFPVNIDTSVSGNSPQGPPRFFLQRAITTHQIFGGPTPANTPPPYPVESQVALLPATNQVQHALAMTSYDMERWDYSVETNVTYLERTTFRNYMEGHTGLFSSVNDEPFGDQMHGRVHLWVGGNLSSSSSPNDPLFWLHHANLDRIWAEWQDAHGVFNFPSSWTYLSTNGTPVGQTAVEVLWGFSRGSNYVADVTSLDTLDLRATGRRYDTQSEKTPPSLRAEVAALPDGLGIRIAYPAMRGLVYRLETAVSLGDVWQPEGPELVADSDTVRFETNPGTAGSGRVYRVSVRASGIEPVQVSSAERASLKRRQTDAICGIPAGGWPKSD